MDTQKENETLKKILDCLNGLSYKEAIGIIKNVEYEITRTSFVNSSKFQGLKITNSNSYWYSNNWSFPA